MIRLERITLYPIKSLDGVQVPLARVLASGALEHDRRFALIDSAGMFVNAKRTAKIQTVRAAFQLAPLRVQLTTEGLSACQAEPSREPETVAHWMQQALGTSASLVENPAAGHPDDTDAPGPTLISRQSLEAIAAWFELSLEECRRRFRTNLEIEVPSPFWEDQLVGHTFTVGQVRLQATGVCQRCAVPGRNSHSGATQPGFAKRFAQLRQENLPSRSPPEAFDHFYRVAVNTRLVGSPGEVRTGDKLSR